MVFSAGGIGPLNGDVRERRLEYFDIADDASHAPYGMQGNSRMAQAQFCADQPVFNFH